MQEILEILDYGVAIAIMITVFVFVLSLKRLGKLRFSRFSLSMLCITFCDMMIDGLQGEPVSFVISALMCLFWIYNYRQDRKREMSV